MSVGLRQKHDEVRKFLHEASRPIRSREASKDVERELECHLEELVGELQDQGMDEQLAVQQAVARMGNPAVIGREMGNIYRPLIDWGLLAMLGAIIAIGLWAIYSLSLVTGQQIPYDMFMRHSATVAFGVVMLAVLWQFDYRKLQGWSLVLYATGIIVLITGLWMGTAINGQRTYLPLGPIFIDTSVAGMFLLLLALPGLKGCLGSQNNIKRQALFLVCLALPILLFIAGPAFLSCMLYLTGVTALLWMQRRSTVVFSVGAMGLLLLAGIGIVISGKVYRLEDRLSAFLAPSDGTGYSWWYSRAAEAIQSAGWLGHGPPSMDDAMAWWHSESMFVYMVSSYGWLVGLLIAACSFSLLGWIYRSLRFVKDPYGKTLLSILVSILSIQYVWSIGMCMGWLPFAGFSLPLISFGMAQNLIYFTMLGVMLSVLRRRRLPSGRPAASPFTA